MLNHGNTGSCRKKHPTNPIGTTPKSGYFKGAAWLMVDMLGLIIVDMLGFNHFATFEACCCFGLWAEACLQAVPSSGEINFKFEKSREGQDRLVEAKWVALAKIPRVQRATWRGSESRMALDSKSGRGHDGVSLGLSKNKDIPQHR